MNESHFCDLGKSFQKASPKGRGRKVWKVPREYQAYSISEASFLQKKTGFKRKYRKFDLGPMGTKQMALQKKCDKNDKLEVKATLESSKVGSSCDNWSKEQTVFRAKVA